MPAGAQYPGFGDPGSRQGGGNATGGLVPVQGSVDGGVIPMGTSAQVVLRFRNDGSQPVQTGLIQLYPSSTVTADVTMNQCEGTALPSGAECAMALTVKGIQAGQWRVELLMSHSGRSRLVTATISGTVESSGETANQLTSDIEAIPESVEFGSLRTAQTLVEPVILRNITSTPVEITNMYIDSTARSGFSLKADCKVLAAGQACMAIVSWAPELRGRATGVLIIEHSGAAGLTSVSVSGDYAPDSVSEVDVFPEAIPGKGLLVSSQKDIDFGTSVERASTITVSLVNAGDEDLTLGQIKIAGSDNGISFKEDGCVAETVLPPAEACPLTVTWSPTRVGPVLDDIQILHNGARGMLVLPVRGTAVSAVSQDQQSILLSDGQQSRSAPASSVAPQDSYDQREKRTLRPTPSFAGGGARPSSALDGYKITSFSPSRAIINGPGGSRIVFDNEEIVIGGIPWFVLIQKNGIEFLYQGNRVLMLFDRSLSSANRGSAGGGAAGGAAEGGQ